MLMKTSCKVTMKRQAEEPTDNGLHRPGGGIVGWKKVGERPYEWRGMTEGIERGG